MKITDRLLRFTYLMVCLGLSAAAEMPAQDSPPAPPLPPLPTRPAFRPVPMRTDGAVNKSAAAGVPAVPVPLLHPPAASSNPTVPPAPAAPATPPGALVFDAEQKDYDAKAGEPTANFTFNLTNVSSAEVLVNRVTTSCGCTVARLPEQPWHLGAGTNGPINVTVDLRGKSGTIMKTVTVDTTSGMKQLLVKVTVPPPQLIAPVTTNNMDRTRNIALAQADRQAVFKSDCAECHVKKAVGRLGKELYAGACAICHDAEHRATMVPDLHLLKHPDTRDYWAFAVSEGKVNSLMPAFAQKSGGILNDQQISSLVDYLMTDFAKDTNTVVHAALAPSTIPQPSAVPVRADPANAPAAVLGPFPIK